MLKKPNTNVLFELKIVELPEIMRFVELGFMHDFDEIEVDKCNDDEIRSRMMKLNEILEEEEAIGEVKLKALFLGK